MATETLCSDGKDNEGGRKEVKASDKLSFSPGRILCATRIEPDEKTGFDVAPW